jgi:alpha-N-arabinofuranosidase
MRFRSLIVLITVAGALVGAAANPRPTDIEAVAIDATAVGPPISPLLYGQFIEHAGRGIYGGLWAEMLEDRKFYYPVTGAAPAWEMFTPGIHAWEGEGHPYELLVRSPWLILGDKQAVTMTRDRALTGAPSPRLQPTPAAPVVGLMQERLTLRDGRDYVGRIVLAGTTTGVPRAPSSSALRSSREGGRADTIVEVSLVWGGGASARQTIAIDTVRAGWQTIPLAFRAGGTTDNGRLEILLRGAAPLRIGAVSLMPADNVSGWRSDTIARLRELGATVYRWPGGNFVSGYDWRDGIGDRDRRPPRKNPAWKGVEPNDVGLHEFMELCRLVEAEPYVAVNTGTGDVRAVTDLVMYANAPDGTPMGRLRAENGHPAPFGVRLWAVGNEMYGEWQLGHLPVDRYVAKHREIAAAMWAVDPKIQLVGVGAVGEWSRTMLAQAASDMTFISEHDYWHGDPDVIAHVAQARNGIRRIAEAHRAYRRELPALAGKNLRVALDEWNYWYGAYEYGELGVRYSLKDGLGIAAGLHELFRNSDLFAMANYAQTVNVIGAIKTSADAAELEPTGLVLSLYRHHFGTLPVAVRGALQPLDISAAWTSDRRTLTVAVVNPSPERARRLRLDVAGARIARGGRSFLLTGASPLASNAPGRARGVTIEETAAGEPGDPIDIPPLSVTLLVLGASRRP